MVGLSVMSSRRQARRAVVSPVFKGSDDPNRVTQQSLDFPQGEVRAWFQGGVCHRVRVPGGRMYGREEAPAIWAAIIDGSFWPQDFGKRGR